LRSLVLIDKLPEIRTNGRTRITSRLPTRVTVETRITLRAAVDSPGGGRRSLLCRLAVFSLAPNAPRSAPSTRSGTLAKVISPSSEAKTAPPMRAAPAIDHRGFGTVDGKRRLVTEINDRGLAPVAPAA